MVSTCKQNCMLPGLMMILLLNSLIPWSIYVLHVSVYPYQDMYIVHTCRIPSIKCPGIYLFQWPIYHLLEGIYYRAFIRGRCLFEAGIYFDTRKIHARSCSISCAAYAHMASLCSDYYEKASVVKGDDVHKAVWRPSIGEEFLVPTRRPQRSWWTHCCANEGWSKRPRRQVHTIYMH